MFGISGTELFFIAVFALIIFGPDKLPKMARTVGRFMREFQRAQANVEALLKAELYAAEKPEAAPTTEAAVAAEAAPEEVLASASFGDDADEEGEDEE